MNNNQTIEDREPTKSSGRLNKHDTLIDIFEQKVEDSPNSIAVVMNEETLTYSELNSKAQIVAERLLHLYGTGYTYPAGLFFKRGLSYIVCLLGTMKAGITSLPLDLVLGEERLNRILKDSGCGLIITNKQEELPVSVKNDLTVIDINTIDEKMGSDTKITHHENDLTLMLYSSGTTGFSKGLKLAHKGFVNMVKSQIKAFEISSDDRILFSSSISYDSSIAEIFTSLLSGATLIIQSLAPNYERQQFIDLLIYHRVSVMTYSPKRLNIYSVDDLKSLRVMILAGEILYKRQIWRFCKSIQCFNGYGLTEASVCSTYEYINPSLKYNDVIPIGVPINKTEITIRDSSLKILPDGETGEICISGPGLAKGYHNNEKLSLEKFIVHPEKEGELLYRTGDLGSVYTGEMAGEEKEKKYICLDRITPQKSMAEKRLEEKKGLVYSSLRKEGYRPDLQENGIIRCTFKKQTIHVECEKRYFQVTNCWRYEFSSKNKGKERDKVLHILNRVQGEWLAVKANLTKTDHLYVRIEILDTDPEKFSDLSFRYINTVYKASEEIRTAILAMGDE